jgi:hypothetical protein
MKLWKMSIKTGGTRGAEALRWCRERGIVAVGWSVAFEGLSQLPPDPLVHLAAMYPTAVSPVRMLAQRMQAGDLVWLHHGGQFFVCKIAEGPLILGPDLGSDYREYDVGHARRAVWVQVPEDLVPGKIQRAVISRRMVCRIPGGKHLAAYCALLHARLQADPGWRPIIDPIAVHRALEALTPAELVELASPDDWEDVIAAYLQLAGWVLVKSSCFRSKPRYEFRMIREEAGRTRTAYLQVKSGEQVPLPPADYARDVLPDAEVYLFSTHTTDPYPGAPVPGVTPIPLAAVRAWMGEHVGLLPRGLCARLCTEPAARPG